jgi:hypothetical protein
MVALLKEFYGRGPMRTKSFDEHEIRDDWLAPAG